MQWHERQAELGDKDPPEAWRNCAKRFARLLDFYFHPFTVQHNRLILHAAVEEQGSSCWRWPLATLARELRRVGDALRGLGFAAREAFLLEVFGGPTGALKHVRLLPRASKEEPVFLGLTYEADFRVPVITPARADGQAAEAGRLAWVRQHFLAAKECRQPLPGRASILLSYALNGGTAKDRGRLILRQLLAYTPDIICLQRCEGRLQAPASSHGVPLPLVCDGGGDENDNAARVGAGHASLFAELRSRLECEDYEWCVTPATRMGFSCGHVNAVFWRRSTWRAEASISAGEGGVLQVSLCRQQAPGWRLSVCSVEVGKTNDLSDLIRVASIALPSHLGGSHSAGRRQPAVLCGTFGSPPEDVRAALAAEGMLSLRSALPEVLGRDLRWTDFTPDGTLRRADGIWFGSGVGSGGDANLAPVAALGGFRKGPRRSAAGGICRQTFPSDHLPLVVAMELRE